MQCVSRRFLMVLTAGVVASIAVAAQTPSAQPTFDVVSIRPNTSGSTAMSISNRPDGGFTATNLSVTMLLTQAFRGAIAAEMEGLPAWASTERFDVTATAMLTDPTPDERAAMIRAMLIDRFQLVARVETRDMPAFDLVLARGDGRPGPQLRPTEVDCLAQAAASRAALEQARGATLAPPQPPVLPDPTAPAPPCTIRMTGPRMEGDMTMMQLASLVRPAAGRHVVDKTGLEGSYRIVLEYDRMAGLRAPDPGGTLDGPPSVFTALEDQLGLRLVPSRAEREVLVIERLERPTEN